MVQAPRKSFETRTHLLDTAMELISKSNYTSVGVAEICDSAGVTKGSFYHYFDSKAALFEAACDHYWEEKKKHLDAIFSPEHDSLTRLETWLDYVVDKLKKDDGEEVAACPIFASGAQCGENEPAVRDATIRLGEKILKYNVALVKGLQDDGHLARPGDLTQLARMLVHYVQGLFLYAQIQQDETTAVRDIREGVYRLIGLKPDSWPPTRADVVLQKNL